MKKFLVVLISLLFIQVVDAINVSEREIDSSTYIIGKHIYTRNTNENYDGVLTTERIMLSSKTITSDKESDMIIYYKNARGNWIDAITGEEKQAPNTFDIKVVDLGNIEENPLSVSLIDGKEFNRKIKQLAGNSNANYNSINTNITAFRRADTLPNITLTEDNVISTSNSETISYAWYEDGVIYYYLKSYAVNGNIYLNEDSSYMFNNLVSLTNLDLSNFDTSNVIDISYMFQACKAITSLDLSGFNMSKVAVATDMLMLPSLTTLKTPKISSDVEIVLNTKMYDELENGYEKLTSEIPDKIILQTPTALISGRAFNDKIKRLAGALSNITEIVRETNSANIPVEVIDNEENVISVNNSYSKVYAWYNNGIIYYYSDSNKIYLNEDSSYMFNNLISLNSIDLGNFDTSNVTNMLSMFSLCQSLISIDLSNFDTSNVTNMSEMFRYCPSLISLDLSNFDISNVINIDNMLLSLDALTTLKTPKLIPVGLNISLSKPMYYQGNATAITVINSTHVNKIFKSTSW